MDATPFEILQELRGITRRLDAIGTCLADLLQAIKPHDSERSSEQTPTIEHGHGASENGAI